MAQRGWAERAWAAALAAAAAAGAAQAAPRLVVDRPLFDFGSVEQGTPVEHVFKVRNAGDAPLRIEQVKGTCACTVGAATGAALPPGDHAYVAVRLDTSRLAGRTTKTMTLVSNDPAAPSQPITVAGTVETDLVVAPTPLYLGRVRPGATVRREVRIAPGGSGGHHRVTFAESGTPAVRVHVQDAAPDGTQRVFVDVDPSLESGRFDDVVRLRTTSARQPWIEVPVFGVVDTAVAVLPSLVTFGIGRAGSTPADVRIRSRRPLAVTRVTAPDALEYELTTVRAGVEYLLTLRLRSEVSEPERFEGRVEVFTDDPEHGRIVVPVYAIDRRRG